MGCIGCSLGDLLGLKGGALYVNGFLERSGKRVHILDSRYVGILTVFNIDKEVYHLYPLLTYLCYIYVWRSVS